MSEPQVLGRYLICDEIGGGGMAKVYLGRVLGAAGFSRVVAIKRVHPSNADDAAYATMLLDEARLAARIRHPNVVPTLDVVNLGSELILVMDYVHGPSLAWLKRRLARRGERAPLPIVARIILDVLAGLHAAHQAKSERGRPLEMVHRDVSPHNVLISDDGAARLADFGIAKADGKLSLTQVGQVKGKLSYMAPEQLRGEEVDRRADIFATGIVLWELLTGEELFRIPPEGHVAGMIQKILTATVAAPSSVIEIPAALDAVVLKALRAAPAERFDTAEAMATALEAATEVATAKDVAAWIAVIARELLDKRAALVAHVEQTSAVHDLAALAPAAPAPAAPRTAPSLPPRMSTERPPAPLAKGTLDHAPTTPTALPKKRISPVILGLALGLSCAAVVLAGLVRSARDPQTTRASQALVTTLTSPEAPAPAPPSADADVATATATATAPSPALPTATSRSTTTSATVSPTSRRLSHPPAPPPPPPGSPSPPKVGAPDCDPPYSIDPQGVRIPRRECLGR